MRKSVKQSHKSRNLTSRVTMMLHYFNAMLIITLSISVKWCDSDITHMSAYSNLMRISELQFIQSHQLANPLSSSDPAIIQYNECILKLQQSKERRSPSNSIFGPFFLFRVEGVPIKYKDAMPMCNGSSGFLLIYVLMTFRLSCSSCVPSEYIASWTKLSFENLQKEIQRTDENSNSTDLIIDSPTADLSTYYCSWLFNKTEVLDFMWTVEIVPSSNLQKVASRNWTRPAPKSFEGIKIGTHLEEWSTCSKCGVVGKRHRIAYCTVKYITDAKQPHQSSQTWQAFAVYSSISCNLFLNLHPQIGSLNQKASQALARRPQVLVGYCKLPCTHFDTRFQAWQEDLSNSTHPVFYHIYSRQFDEPWEYETEDEPASVTRDDSKKRLTISQMSQLLVGLKNIRFSKEYIPEILSLSALLTLQLFIFIQIYRNRRTAR